MGVAFNQPNENGAGDSCLHDPCLHYFFFLQQESEHHDDIFTTHDEEKMGSGARGLPQNGRGERCLHDPVQIHLN